MIKEKREAGILLHISSLPSKYGIGTLGKEAYKFVDYLYENGIKIWQVLPLTCLSFGNSPYQSPSADGLNYYFIDLETLMEKGLLSQEDLDNYPVSKNDKKVDYSILYNNRKKILKKAFSNFDKSNGEFVEFVNSKKYHDFAFYMALKEINNDRPFNLFDEKYKNYSPQLEEEFIRENYNLYLFFVWTQYEFLNQYTKLKTYANNKDIKILGDMPIYVAYDSVEVYKYPYLFQLDENKNPTFVAGCPPDFFSDDGQLWGNPIYNWEDMKKDNYKWFSNRIYRNLEIFDILRIDHFRGFAGYYAIPYGDKNARRGHWEKGPGIDLFKDKLNLQIVAEDLGLLDDDVYTLMKQCKYPGMKTLCFAFDGNETNSHLPSNSTQNSVCYTGTHDNMPLVGQLKEYDENQLKLYRDGLKKECLKFSVEPKVDTIKDMAKTTCELVYASPSGYAICQFQDLVGGDENTRMNLPAVIGDNWTYRITQDDLSETLSVFLKKCIKKYNR